MKPFTNVFRKLFFLTISFLYLHSPCFAAQTIDQIIAIVGDDIILFSELEAVMKAKGVNGQETLKKKQVLDNLIEQSLLHQEIKKKDIAVSDEELARAIHDVLRNNQMTLESLKEELRHKNASFEQYKEELRREIKQAKFIGQVIYPRIQVSAMDIKNFREQMLIKNKNIDQLSEENLRRLVADTKLTEEIRSYLQEVRRHTYINIIKE